MKNRPSNHVPQHCLTPRNDRRHTVKSLPKKKTRCDPLLHQTHTTHPSFILKETLRRPQWIAEKPCKYTLTIYSKSHQSGPGQYTDPVTSSLIIFMQCYHFLILPRVTNKNPQTRECINSTVNSGKWTGYFYINCMEFRMGFDGGDADSSQTCRHVDQNYERKKRKKKRRRRGNPARKSKETILLHNTITDLLVGKKNCFIRFMEMSLWWCMRYFGDDRFPLRELQKVMNIMLIYY